MLAAPLLLRFDGSFSGSCGGAGAVLSCAEGGAIRWEGARFLPRCSSSAIAEYEGLLLGLAAAARIGPAALQIEGDCRVVIGQVCGDAKPRKLGKYHRRARALIDTLEAQGGGRARLALLPRASNGHADALSRVAVEAAQALHSGAILSAARTGRRDRALQLLERAGQDGVPRTTALFDTLLCACDSAADWRMLLSVYAEGKAATAHSSECALALAIGALEALGARGGGPDSRQLAELRRVQEAAGRRAAKQAEREAASPATVASASTATNEAPAALVQARRLAGGALSSDDWAELCERDGASRSGPAARWAATLVAEAGGVKALQGFGSSPPHLVGLARRLSSEQGLGLVEDEQLFEAPWEEPGIERQRVV
jgi:ribonuclease HI